MPEGALRLAWLVLHVREQLARRPKIGCAHENLPRSGHPWQSLAHAGSKRRRPMKTLDAAMSQPRAEQLGFHLVGHNRQVHNLARAGFASGALIVAARQQIRPDSEHQQGRAGENDR